MAEIDKIVSKELGIGAESKLNAMQLLDKVKFLIQKFGKKRC